MPTQTIHCPRCGESLPAGAERCDSCGAYLVAVPAATSHGGASRPQGAPHAGSNRPAQARSGAVSKGKKPRKPADVPGIAYLFLATGLVVGGKF